MYPGLKKGYSGNLIQFMESKYLNVVLIHRRKAHKVLKKNSGSGVVNALSFFSASSFLKNVIV